VSIAEQRPLVPRPPDGSGPGRWRQLRGSATPWQPPDLPTTIVVPHPDDEALLFGGLIAALTRRSIRCDVIAVTDGESAYDGVDRRALAARRRCEQDESFDLLGVDASRIHRLGLPDGAVAEHADALTAAIVDRGNSVVVAPWRHDHHCDHEACGRAAERAAMTLGAALYGGMFWAWHHTSTDALRRTDQDAELLALALDAASWHGRLEALARHRTQLGTTYGPPVLTGALLEPVRWPCEYYVAGPSADGVGAHDRAS